MVKLSLLIPDPRLNVVLDLFLDDFSSFFRPPSRGRGAPTYHEGSSQVSSTGYAEGRGGMVSTQTKTIISTSSSSSKFSSLFGSESTSSTPSLATLFIFLGEFGAQTSPDQPQTEEETPRVVQEVETKQESTGYTGRFDMGAMKSWLFSDDDDNNDQDTPSIKI